MSEKWVLVPVEATHVQMQAGWGAFERREVYAAMLAARPPIPAAVLDAMVERGARALDEEIGPGVFTVRQLARACILAALTGDA